MIKLLDMKRIFVNQKLDIEGADPMFSDNCPVTRALRRQGYPLAIVRATHWAPWGEVVKRRDDPDEYLYSDDETTEVRELPSMVQKRIFLYDRTGIMLPFSFEIEEEEF